MPRRKDVPLSCLIKGRRLLDFRGGWRDREVGPGGSLEFDEGFWVFLLGYFPRFGCLPLELLDLGVDVDLLT